MESFALLIASCISALGAVLAVYVKNKIDYRKKNCLESSTVSGTNIYQALEYIQSQSECARAYVFEFHNGEHFFSGRGQQKFSCTYEKVRAGVSSESLSSQGHRISNYNQYIHDVISEGKFAYLDIEEISDESFKCLLRSKGVRALYNVPIKTLQGKVIGILGVDYITPQENFCLSDECSDPEKFMRRQARIISGYLV
jgi:hypothetical protein|tara:strand:+ start:1106 stop:1699 length:594 start_codon:yes stop_codon:yes gene_type:complete